MNTEEQLLNDLNSFKYLLQEHEDVLYKIDKDDDKAIVANKIANLKGQIAVVERDLTRIMDNPITIRKRDALLSIILDIIKALNPLGGGYSVSKSQSTVQSDLIYGKIMVDLNNAFENGEHYQSRSEYYQDINQNVDYLSLQGLLHNKYGELLKGKFNYITLRGFVKTVNDEIRELAKRKN